MEKMLLGLIANVPEHEKSKWRNPSWERWVISGCPSFAEILYWSCRGDRGRLVLCTERRDGYVTGFMDVARAQELPHVRVLRNFIN